MSTMTVPCGFCGQRGKIDNEHVWADWISRALAPMKMRIEFGRNEKVRIWIGVAINMTVLAFCQSCNSGWMSELEAATKPTLSPMLKGVPKVLGTTDERLLATWVMKTAMVAEYFNADRKYFTPQERYGVMKTLTPPPSVRIWLAHYIGKQKAHNVSDHLRFPRASDGALVPAFCSTLTAGQFAFQVFSYRWALAESHTFNVRAAPWYTMGRWETTTLLPLWPVVRDVALIWPPRHAITDWSLPVLCKRFVVALKPTGIS